MARGKIVSNKKIFTDLYKFCKKNGVTIRNVSKGRWLETFEEDRDFITDAKLTDVLTFSARRHLVRFEFNSKVFVSSIGFDFPSVFFDDYQCEVHGGMLTALLGEVDVLPTGTASEIRDIVEFSSDDDPDYTGHDIQSVCQLFPVIKFYNFGDDDESTVNSIFFQFCLDECRSGPYWIDDDLQISLRKIAILDNHNFPFSTIFRSIFDNYPSSLFLSLYRFLEALYSYDKYLELIEKLNLAQSWEEVSHTLEDVLGWRPHEEGGLISLFGMASETDLRSLIKSMGFDDSEIKEISIKSVAAKRFYKLRNSLVHFRPAHKNFDMKSVDWKDLCISTCNIVLDVYSEIFSRREAS
jgi:hypothetical protein